MVQCVWEGDTGIGAVTGNVWSRSARRKIKPESKEEEGDEVRLGFRVQVRDTGQEAQVDVEWRSGRDGILFESLCGKLKSIVQQSQHTDSK